MKWLTLFTLLCGCGAPQYSPWQSNPPSYDLTAKHLGWLATQDAGQEVFTLAVIGDPQAVVGSLDRAIEIINYRSDVDFTVIVGDLTDRGLLQEFIWVDRTIAKSQKPVLTIVGNHDGLSNGKKLYQQMFGPVNYTFFYKDVKFVMWNNNGYEWQVDVDWLDNEVRSYHRVIVIAHQPPRDGALSEDQERQWERIRQYPNLIASIHGHVHRFDFKKEGSLPIYTVDRVTNAHYGTVSVSKDQVVFENCFPVCSLVGGQ